ncbi:MAG: AAA-like domain-containing protein [bacterium]|nr:AAA-like domain-containing protein [bacterium]
MTKPSPYRCGGTFYNDSYILRKADIELEDEIRINDYYPYILAARQSGKSSLISRAFATLRNDKLFRFAHADLNRYTFSEIHTYRQFLAYLFEDIGDLLNINEKQKYFLNDVCLKPFPIDAFIRFVIDLMEERLVICIDEIDQLMECTFKDDFFSQIRATFNKRSERPELRKVQFILSGAAPAHLLIKDRTRSPFNVGREVKLNDFDNEQLKKLVLAGWPDQKDLAEEGAERLRYWANGHVYLSQVILDKLYKEYSDQVKLRPFRLIIDEIAQNILKQSQRNDNFTTIRDRLIANRELFETWVQWVSGITPGVDEIQQLEIVGIASGESPFRNTMYQRVFEKGGALAFEKLRLMLADKTKGVEKHSTTVRLYEFDAFFAYTKKDYSVAKKLALELEKKIGWKVWLENRDVQPGEVRSLARERALTKSRYYVWFGSKSSLEDWSRFELESIPFRDISDVSRRFIPIFLESIKHPVSIRNYRSINLHNLNTQSIQKIVAKFVALESKQDNPQQHLNWDESIYQSAKVVILGDSGVGKTGLFKRLTHNSWLSTESTHGMSIGRVVIPKPDLDDSFQKEVWLWDFAGQPAYRLIHQLFLDETTAALLVFNPQDETPFDSLTEWESYLNRLKFRVKKILVASRVDVGNSRISKSAITSFMSEHNYVDYIETSAKTGVGVDLLLNKINDSIPWHLLPSISSPPIFMRLRDEVIELRDKFSSPLISQQALKTHIIEKIKEETDIESSLEAVLSILAQQGIITLLPFGDYVLLQPELIDDYASTIVLNALQHGDEMGCVNENDVLEGRINLQGVDRIANKSDEKLLLMSILRLFNDKALCLREETRDGIMLVFPSYLRRERPDKAEYPDILVTYSFIGHLEDIFASLVVRLTYSGIVRRDQLWHNAADFITETGQQAGFAMKDCGEGKAELVVYFESRVELDTKISFIRFVHDHLQRKANDVIRVRTYLCDNCHHVFGLEEISYRIKNGHHDIGCPVCDSRVNLNDIIEQKFLNDRFDKYVRAMDDTAQIILDNQSRELLMTGQMFVITGQSRQIFRPVAMSDWGIDGEIEFVDDNGRASGKKIYLELKHGDSYLRKQKNGEEVFDILSPRLIEYWINNPVDVYLVVRTGDEKIRWMNISQALKQQKKRSNKIVFTGTEFTSESLLKLRDQVLGITGKRKS